MVKHCKTIRSDTDRRSWRVAEPEERRRQGGHSKKALDCACLDTETRRTLRVFQNVVRIPGFEKKGKPAI